MLQYYVSKDGSTLDSKIQTSPLKPLFMLLNLITGLLLICIFKQAEHWLLIAVGFCFALVFILYLIFYIYLFCKDRERLR